jgi:hypothetical protein
LVVAGKKEGEQQKGGARFGFIAAHCFVEERERKGGHGIGLKTAGGAGGALGCVATAWLRRPDVARQGEDSGGGAEWQGGAHGRAVAAACGRGETEERKRGVDEGGPKCNFREMQGPYCNA